MAAVKDIIGQRFGRLTVIGRAGSTSIGNTRVECRCDCGNITQPHTADLRRGTTQSCGCLSKEKASKRAQKQFTKDITGQRFGRLIALHPTGERRNDKIIWRYRCNCGREIETRAGPRAQSCGCLQRQNAAQLKYRHGSHKSPLYSCWLNIKQRCFNPKCKSYKNYGALGISMWVDWINDFAAFRDYVNQNLGPRPKGKTLDRIDDYRNYEPGNLKWSTPSEQNLNSRRSKLHKKLEALMREDTL